MPPNCTNAHNGNADKPDRPPMKKQNDVGMKITGFSKLAYRIVPTFKQVLTKRHKYTLKMFKSATLKIFLLFFIQCLHI